ncbi:fungal specific transcription factor domain-containing protein [Phlyctema vagabunda]|uniref:Fungal specific transcription factor domain-containing protein n=1 Tax=Phlyctema vagabunda TaxID=108571 RepID=A0ABR4P885_9HELO
MDGPPSKRKRIVTACVECHRRKQKCNHGKPCSNCEARNVRDRCIYDDDGNTNNSLDALPKEAEPQHDGFNLTGQAGYSLNADNSYTALQRSLLGSADTNAGTSRHNSVGDSLKHILGQLPAKRTIKGLIDNYFEEANWYFLVLERVFFNELYSSWLESCEKDTRNEDIQLKHFPALLFQVLAVSLQFLPLNSPCGRALALGDLKTADQLSYKYSTAGLDIDKTFGRHPPSIVSVQHALMRSLWLKNCSRGIEAWYSLGDAIRQAQDLGLHLQSHIDQSDAVPLEKTLRNLWYDEYKRRLWMTLFVWDSHMAFSLGRPRAINAVDCTARLPLDCNIPEQPSRIIPTPINATDVPSTYCAQLFHYFISQKMHEILSKGANKSHFADYSFIQNVHDQIVSYLQNLPPAVRPENPDTSFDLEYPRLLKQRQHISNAARCFLVALHRPHFHQHQLSRKAATEAAFACLKAQQQLFELVGEHQHRIYNLSFYTIDASMFLSAMVLEQSSVDKTFLIETYSALCASIYRLTVMQARSALARSGLQMLTSCKQKICEVHGIDPSLSGGIFGPSAQGPQDDILASNPGLDFNAPVEGNLPMPLANNLSTNQQTQEFSNLNANGNVYAAPSFEMGLDGFDATYDAALNWNSFLDDQNNLDFTDPFGEWV